MYAASNAASISALWSRLETSHLRLVKDFITFWAEHGVPLRKEPNLSAAACFLQPVPIGGP